MVFFANDFIESRKEEKREQEDHERALLLMSVDNDLTYDSAIEKVKAFRMREDVGLVGTSKKSN